MDNMHFEFFLLSKGGDKVISHFNIVKRRIIICTLNILLKILMICDYDDDFDDFEIWWWFDYMGVLYDNFMFWVVDLVIDGIMVHDIFVWWFVYGVGFYHDL